VGAQRIGLSTFLDVYTVCNCHDREDEQGGNLDNVDNCIDTGCSTDASKGNVRDSQGENDCESEHEDRTGITGRERAGEQLAEHVSDKKCGYADHYAGIYPVIQMAGPPNHELHDAGPPKGLLLGK